MQELREIQKIEIEALDELDRICKKHGINYYLAQGTLLGAVRQNAFIPWDDDIDVLVHAEEMERLIQKFAEEADKKYFITNHNIEKYNPLSWTKIRCNNTASMPRKYKKIPIHWGICIDIFPFYNVSDNFLLRKAEIFLFKAARKLLLMPMVEYDEKKSVLDKIILKIPLDTRKRLANSFMRALKRNNGKETECVYVTCKGGKVIEKEIICGKKRTQIFEGKEYPVPSDSEAFLSIMFGDDYMTPPPEAERKGHEQRMGEIIWDCHNSYEKYQ